MTLRIALILSISLFASCAPEAKDGRNNEAPEAIQKAKPAVTGKKAAPTVKKTAEAKPEKAVEPVAAAKPGAEPEVFVGKVVSVSNKAKTLQVKNIKTGKTVIIRADKTTKFVNADGFKQFKAHTKIKVSFVAGQPAVQLERMLVKVAPEMVIKTEQVLKTISGKTPYTLVDARPAMRFNQGHLPSSISIFAKDLKKNLAKLPKDKAQLVIFYCGGVTCGLSPKSAKVAKGAGYTNVKVYVAGMPGWKKAGHSAVLEAALAKPLQGPNAVFIDARSDVAKIAAGHLPGAVHFDMAAFNARDTALAEAPRARLLGVRDVKAPIIIYGDDAADPRAAELDVALRGWGYKRTVVLKGGLKAWTAAKLSVEKTAPATSFVYVRKILPGSITLDAFKAGLSAKTLTPVDVRGEDEATGKLVNALHVPLDTMEANLAKLPKDKALVVYCETGTRAALAYSLLKEKGYTQVQFLDDEFTSVAAAAAPAKKPVRRRVKRGGGC